MGLPCCGLSSFLCCMQEKLNGTTTAAADRIGSSPSGQDNGKKRKAMSEEDSKAAPASKPKKATGARKESRDNESSHDSAAPGATSEGAQVTKKSAKAGTNAPADPSAVNAVAPEPSQQRRKARVVHVVSVGEGPGLAAFKATPRSGWWGARRFSSAGEPTPSRSYIVGSVCWFTVAQAMYLAPEQLTRHRLP